MSFQASLDVGRAGESLVAMWLRARGNTVLPVYEKIIDEGKGPQLFTPTAQMIAPDMLVYRGNNALWVEAKHKTAFSWHRNTQKFVTGIDLRHYTHYLHVDASSPFPVWLIFLHRGGRAKDSPLSPSGLFGNSLDVLRNCENHRHEKWGRTGMVYWAIDSLVKLADLSDVLNISRHAQGVHEVISVN